MRARGHDILLLADCFLADTCLAYGLTKKMLAAEAQAALLSYPWPGNVRELAFPYLPVLDLVRTLFGTLNSDSPAAIADKVRWALADAGVSPSEGSPFVLQLLGLKEGQGPLASVGPHTVKARTFDTLRRLFVGGSRRVPLILTVEDLHWIDRTSEDFLEFLVEVISRPPASTLLNAGGPSEGQLRDTSRDDFWWRVRDSNPRPRRCERRALPTELTPRAQASLPILQTRSPIFHG